MKAPCLLVSFIFVSLLSVSQEVGLSDTNRVLKNDTTTLYKAFKYGKVNTHFRSFFMSTINAGNLSDYVAQAVGGGVLFESLTYKNFQFGVGGFYFFNLGSSNLTQLDPTTNQSNRYEIGLFDVEDPSNKKDLYRLEELYLNYHFKQGKVRFGKQFVNTPFINLQDGRMRPTGVEGLWMDFTSRKFTFEGGYLYKISPRGTTSWYSVGESIGIYPMGNTELGLKSNYASNIHSDGIAVFGVTNKTNKHFHINAWNYLVLNVMNLVFVQNDYFLNVKDTLKQYTFSSQLAFENAHNQGGNIDSKLSYMSKGSKAFSFGFRLQRVTRNWTTSINYNHIVNEHRFVFPREWGREPFFTFQPRERNEGTANSHAFLIKTEHTFPKRQFIFASGLGFYKMPSVLDSYRNKYGLPSYFQCNIDLKYKCNTILKGLDIHLLMVTKLLNGSTFGNLKYEINKVNMFNVNLVLNYHF